MDTSAEFSLPFLNPGHLGIQYVYTHLAENNLKHGRE